MAKTGSIQHLTNNPSPMHKQNGWSCQKCQFS
jgi:CRISPR/Cas system-associated exonuclease Cas4 (RecB family)